jgi:hypothetical protein
MGYTGQYGWKNLNKKSCQIKLTAFFIDRIFSICIYS